jgi:prepilin-type N-terminal cleavage/methylation domain-containing protein
VRRQRHRHERGFTLLEAVIAMAVFGFAILVAAGFLDAQMSAARRLEARADLLRAAEVALESVRGGALPLESAAVELGDEFRPLSAIRVATAVEVRPCELEGLYEVEAVARAVVRGEGMEVSVTTRVWRP